MKALGLVVVLLALGCASSKLTVQYATIEQPLGIHSRVIDYVILEPGFYGRGCFDVVLSGSEVQITVQQDGTTDWIAGRAAPGILRELVTAAIGFATGPFDLLKAMLGVEPARPSAPSDTHGCGGVFED